MINIRSVRTIIKNKKLYEYYKRIIILKFNINIGFFQLFRKTCTLLYGIACSYSARTISYQVCSMITCEITVFNLFAP